MWAEKWTIMQEAMVDQHYTNVNTIAINLQEIICKW